MVLLYIFILCVNVSMKFHNVILQDINVKKNSQWISGFYRSNFVYSRFSSKIQFLCCLLSSLSATMGAPQGILFMKFRSPDRWKFMPEFIQGFGNPWFIERHFQESTGAFPPVLREIASLARNHYFLISNWFQFRKPTKSLWLVTKTLKQNLEKEIAS